MADTVEVRSHSEAGERTCYPVSSGALRFHVRAAGSRATLILLTKPELAPPTYEIRFYLIEGNNYHCNILRDGIDQLATSTVPDLVSDEEYRAFWVTWYQKKISVGHDGDARAFVVAEVPECSEIQYVTPAPVPGGNCMWKFELAPLWPKTKEVAVAGGAPEWREIEAGAVPIDALIAGSEDNKPLYVIRGNHHGSLVPGKLKFGDSIGYVAWGGNANPKHQYEILVGYNVHWVPASGGAAIPEGAVWGGYAEHTREPLYVGRAHHEGHLIVGKVQRSHRALYIPYQGKEVAKSELEILVANTMPSEGGHGVRLELPRNIANDGPHYHGVHVPRVVLVEPGHPRQPGIRPYEPRQRM